MNTGLGRRLTLQEGQGVCNRRRMAKNAKEKECESPRAVFEWPLTAQMMTIDGTWRRPCFVKDVV